MSDGSVNQYLLVERLASTGRKTSVWHVKSKRSGASLGEVKWFGRWRQFAFFPAADTVFNAECIRHITGVIEAARLERLAAREKA